MSATVIPLRGRRARPVITQETFNSTVNHVAAIPAADLLDASFVSLGLARLTPGTSASYGCCVKALLCLSRLVEECKPAEEADA